MDFACRVTTLSLSSLSNPHLPTTLRKESSLQFPWLTYIPHSPFAWKYYAHATPLLSLKTRINSTDDVKKRKSQQVIEKKKEKGVKNLRRYAVD